MLGAIFQMGLMPGACGFCQCLSIFSNLSRRCKPHIEKRFWHANQNVIVIQDEWVWDMGLRVSERNEVR